MDRQLSSGTRDLEAKTNSTSQVSSVNRRHMWVGVAQEEGDCIQAIKHITGMMGQLSCQIDTYLLYMYHEIIEGILLPCGF